MAIQISGRLTVASGDQLSFEGCRVEAVFDERRPTGARASAVCDAKGTFTLEVLDHDEFPGETIRFVALSPTGRRIGAREFVVAELGDNVTIDVEPFEPAPHDDTSETPEHAAVKGLFEADAMFRRTLTDNLKPLRAESAVVDDRVKRAFVNFSSTALSADGTRCTPLRRTRRQCRRGARQGDPRRCTGARVDGQQANDDVAQERVGRTDDGRAGQTAVQSVRSKSGS
jgi:hypothetical protein